MNLPRASVRRPVFTTMVTLIVVLLGVVSLSKLRTDLLPKIDLPNISVRTNYPGASPQVVESSVTRIIEEILGTVPGIEHMNSSSAQGRSQVRLTFAWGTDVDQVATDVRARLEDEMSELPNGVERPELRKFDPDSAPVVILGIASDLDPVQLTSLVENTLRRRFAQLPGVAQLDTWGSYNREVRVAIDPDRLRALQLPLDDVLNALRNANLDLPAGEIESGRFSVGLRAPARFVGLDDIRETVVTLREGAAVTLGQIAEVTDTYERLTRHIRIDGRLGLRVAIRKQADANTVEVSEAVLAEVEAVNRDFRQISVRAISNQGNFIERSIDNVSRTVLYGGVLAVGVLIFFLRNLRSTLVISLAIPISIIATFALLYFGGFTLNLMTLGGLALGVGMMVDSSIVVLENIFRRQVENGEDRVAAATAGAGEVGPAIVASTITTAVIFLPLIFVPGVSGVLFKELAWVVVFSLIAALAVSLSLVPMLASRLLRQRMQRDVFSSERSTTTQRSVLTRAADAVLGGIDSLYRDALAASLRHPLVTIVTALGALGLSLLLVPQLGSEFMPPSDEGTVSVNGQMETATRLDLVDEQMRKLEAVVNDAVPERIATLTHVRSTRGAIDLTLSPAAERERTNEAIAADLRERLEGKTPGLVVRTRAPRGQFLLDRLIRSGDGGGLTVEVRGHELDTLRALAREAADAMAQVPGVTDVEDPEEEGLPEQSIRIDRDRIADAGLSVRDVGRVLEVAVAGRSAGIYQSESDAYPIKVQLKDAHRMQIDQVLDLTVRGADDDPVALRSLVTVAPDRGTREIRRVNQRRQLTISGNVSGAAQGTVSQGVARALERIPRPEGYELRVAGGFAEQQKAFRELMISLGLALLLVYMVLACQYESLRDPLVVMFSVPLAAIGVLVTLFLTNTTLNVQTYIGCIMLGGIVVNNAILLVDQAGRLRERDGMAVRAAVAEAGRRRLRPILMTSLTTVLGLLPLALGIGEGADAQAPLARAVIGGLVGSTLITLVLIPVVYVMFHPEREAQPQPQTAPEAA